MTDIRRKILFVTELSDAITKVQPNVIDVNYQVYKNSTNRNTIEVLVVNYAGGARSIRNCTGNSCSAVLMELSRLLDYGYYDEERWFRLIETDPNYLRVFD